MVVEKDWLSYDWSNWKRIFNNFIGGYFNLDTDNIYEALNEFIKKTNDDEKTIVLGSVEKFLENDEMSKEEKEKFIDEETMIDYEAYGLNSLKWIEYIKEKLEENLEKE